MNLLPGVSRVLCILGALLLPACLHNGGGTATAGPSAASASVVATVADSDGHFLAGVTVRVQATGATAVTDAGGRATVAVPLGAEQVLRLHKDGFAERSDAFTLPPGTTTSAWSSVLIVQDAALAIADAQAGFAIAGRDGAAVTLPANALVDARGQLVGGAAEVHITPLDVRTDLRAFPGRFEGFPEGADRTPIVTWGTTEFAFRQNGQPLQLAPNTTAAIVLPIYVPTNQDGSPVTAGQTLPLWSLDEATAIWRQEGSGTVVASATSPTGLALAASVAHFSWWNVDQARNLGNGSDPFQAHVVCRLAAEGGQAVRDLPPGAAATVRITVGDPSAPRAVATDTVGPAGSEELIPADVPVLLEAEAAFGTPSGGFVVAHGSLASTFPAGGTGVVEILMLAVEVPAPRIVAPFEAAVTNSSRDVGVEITLDGDQPDSLELAVDGQLLHTFDAQFFYRYFWDTSTVAEGVHTLVATAVLEGARRPSAPRHVTVDRTPPQVLLITPTPGIPQSGRPGFDIEFNEAVVPTPFRLQDAVVLSSTNGSVVQQLPVTVTQGAAGFTLHIEPVAPLSFGTIGLSWGGLHDTAGNHVTTVGATWPFDLTPPLPTLGHFESSTALAIAVSSTGVPFVAHVPRPDELAVSRYDDANGVWIELPGPLNAGALTDGKVPSLAIDAAGLPTIVYNEVVGGINRYVVKQFAGGWQQLGTPFPAGNQEGVSDLAIDALGRPVVALARNSLVDVRRYDPIAQAFVSLGQPFSGQAPLVSSVDLGCKTDGNPVVAWVEGTFGSNAVRLQARAFDGTVWQPLGGVIDSTPNATESLREPAVVVDGSTFYLAWSRVTATEAVKARRWDGTTWVDLAFVGQPLPSSNAGKLGLAVRNGRLLLAYAAGATPFVAVFDGAVWSPGIEAMGPTSNGAPRPRLAVGNGRTFLSHLGCCSTLGHVVEVLFP